MVSLFYQNAPVMYNSNLINIVDTPGHADFGGEVEQIMSIIDGVALIVDATGRTNDSNPVRVIKRATLGSQVQSINKSLVFLATTLMPFYLKQTLG